MFPRLGLAREPERFACNIERHASARSPATLEFRRGYPAEQLVTTWQFVADVAATVPAESTAADRFPPRPPWAWGQARLAGSHPLWGW